MTDSAQRRLGKGFSMKIIKILAYIANVLLICVGIRVFGYGPVPAVMIFVIAILNILVLSAFKFDYTALHFEKKAVEEKKRIEILKKVVGGKKQADKHKHFNLRKTKVKLKNNALEDYMYLRGK